MPHRIARLLACATAAAATAYGATAHAEELRTVVQQPVESPRRVDPMLTMTGAVFFGIPYTVSVGAAITSDVPADRWLYAPVVGPIGDYIQRAVCTTGPGCRGLEFSTIGLPLVLSSVTQAAGLGIVIVSLARPSKPVPATRAAVRVLPASVGGGPGVTAFGTF
jgi:hypothetical protein